MLNMQRSQSGSAAIEFAIVLPMLLLLVIGMMEFSRAWSASAAVSGAARAAARSYAIHSDPDRAVQEAISTGVGVELNPTSVTLLPEGGCAAGQTATARISHTMPYLTGLFGNNLVVFGEGMYPCQG